MNDEFSFQKCRGDLKLPRHFAILAERSSLRNFKSFVNLGFALISMFFLASCTEKLPSPIIPDERTTQIMVDLAVAEAAVQPLNGYQKDSLMMVYFSQVFEIHGVTKAQYEENMKILSQDLPRLQKCLETADEKLKNDKTK